MKKLLRHAKRRWTKAFGAVLLLQAIFGHPSNGHTASQPCELYPIVLSWSSVSNIVTGAVLNNLVEGVQSGNFGWLSWSGKNVGKTLATSLTAPGDSYTYQDPDDSRDRTLNLDDWVSAANANNNKDVRDALEALKTFDITVPVWNLSRGQTGKGAYRVWTLARVRLLSYDLVKGRLSVRFIRFVSCEAANKAPVVDAGTNRSLALPKNWLCLRGAASDDGLPRGSKLSVLWTQVSGPGGVTISNASASKTFVGYSRPGTYKFRLTANDTEFYPSNDVEVVITAADLNHVPVAESQSITVNEDNPVNITLSGSDEDGDALTYTVMSLPNSGTLSGTVPDLLYMPRPNFFGSDRFTYCVSDGSLTSTVATVSITVNPVNDAPVALNQSVAADEDTPLSITLSGADVEGSTLRFSIVTQPAHGTLTGDNAQWVYKAARDYNGSDRFTFKANDGALDSTPAEVLINVRPVNDPPIAESQQVTVPEDGSVNITLVGRDPEGGLLTCALISNPAHGTLTGTLPNMRYSPARNFFGRDSFSFVMNDGELNSQTATVLIDVTPVNDAPVALPVSVSLNEDASVSITLTGTDEENDPVTFAVVSGPLHGVLSGAAPNLVYTPNQNYFGSDSFTFKANDGRLDSAEAVVSITVDAENDGPAAHSQTVNVNEDQSVALVLSGDDPENDPLSFTVVSGASHGSLSGTAPNLTYTPAANFNGPDSFTFMVSDGTLNSSAATVTINVRSVNDAPVANSQTLAVNEDESLNVMLSGSDVENDPLTFVIVSGPEHGTLSGAAPNLTYTPSLNFNGQDRFTFMASDGALNSSAATVTINVAPVNDAPVANSQTLTVNEDERLNIVLSGSDAENDSLAFTVVSGPSHGSLSGEGSNLRYTPALNFFGQDSFRFVVSDGALNSASALVTINVTPVNDAPTADSQTVDTHEDEPLNVVLSGSDVENDPLTFVVLGNPSHGTLSGTGAVLTYTPASNFNGQDSFTFKASDGALSSSAAMVKINVSAVNDPPVANSQTLAVNEDETLNVVLTGTDVENDPLSFNVVSGPSHGTLSGTAPNLTYTPAPNFNGPDSFTFRVSDGLLNSSAAAVVINVAPVNDAPVAASQTLVLNEDESVNLVLLGSDVENDPLTFTVLSSPRHGTLSGTAPNLTYAPVLNYNGPDSLTFIVNDGSLNSAVATVTINVASVNDAPVPNSQTLTLNEDEPVNVVLSATDVENDPLTFTVVSGPSHGTLSGAVPNLTYTPALNFNGSDSFTFAVSDGALNSAGATVTLNVTPVNDAPVANSQTLGLNEDETLNILVSGSDVENDPLTFAVVSGPSHGTLSGTLPNLTYTPALNFNGPDSFTFRVSDGLLNSSAATVMINVAPVNDAPVANSQTLGVNEDETLNIVLSGSDVENDPLTFIVVAGPTHGSLSGEAPNLTYTPALNFNGSDSFTFAVSDGALNSAAATVTLNVTPVNDAPVANSQTLGVNEDETLNIVLSGSDVENDPLTFTVVSGPSHGSLSGTVPNLVYRPALNFNGSDSLTFKVSDSALNSADATVTINVAPVNDVPVANSQTLSLLEDQPLSVALTGSDVDGDTLVFTVTKAPLHGTLSGTAPDLTYTPAANYFGADSFEFTVSDGQVNSASAVVSLTVQAVNDAPVAVGQSLVTDEDVALNLTLAGSDMENSPLAVRVVRNPDHGVLSGTLPNLVYTPALNFNGSDSFTFVVNDGELDSAPATVSLSVTPVNDAPVAQPQSIVVVEGQTLPITLAGTDVDGDSLNFAVTRAPQVGTLSGSAPNLTYTTPLNVYGPGSLAFTVSDGALTSPEAQVSITMVRRVEAGPNQFARSTNDVVTLQGLVRDNGLPTQISWVKKFGPGTVAFGDSANPVTTVSFSTNGIYLLELIVTDSLYTLRDTVEVRIGMLCNDGAPSGMVAWWQASCNTADYLSGKEGVREGGLVFGVGKVGSAFNFDGVDDRVFVAPTSALNIGQGGGLSIEFWMNSSDVTRNGRMVGWHSGDPNGASGINYGVNVWQGSGNLYADIYDTAGNAHQLIAFGVLANNTWNHVALTYDRTTGLGRLYLNGAVRVSLNFGNFVPQTTYNLYFGNIPAEPVFYRGLLDEISLYSRALDPQEIYNIYAAGDVGKCQPNGNQPPTVSAGPDLVLQDTSSTASLAGIVADDGFPPGTNLRVQWTRVSGPGTVTFADPSAASTMATFSAPGLYVLRLTADDAEFSRSDFVEVRVGTICTVANVPGLAAWWPANSSADEVVGGRNGRLVGGATFAAGKVSDAFSFDGVNDAVVVPADPSLNLGTGGGLSVEFWMNSADVSKAAKLVAWNSGLGTTSTNNGVTVLQSSGTLTAQIYDASGNSHDVTVFGALVNNTWTHVVVTYDRTSGLAKVYLNGAVRTTLAVGSYTPRTSYNVYFGNTPFDNNFYKGLLDEVTLYSRALDPQDVNDLFFAGSTGKCPNNGNQPPLVDAGRDLYLGSTSDAATLNGQATDDGAPNGILHVAWSKLDGPGTVTFANASSATTTATFSAPGIYVLKLAADDCLVSRSDLVEVRVGQLCTVQNVPGLVAWWPANGNGNEVVGGRNVRCGGGATFNPGKVSSSFSFDGVNDFCQVAADSSLDVGVGAGLTVEFWMNSADVSRSGKLVAWHSGLGTPATNNGVTILQSSGNLYAQIYDATGNPHEMILFTSLANNVWTHVAVSYDRATGLGRIYLNGALRLTQNLGSFAPRTSYGMFFGNVPFDVNFYRGFLDEVSLYNRALNVQEIYDVFAAGSTGKCPLDSNQAPLVDAGPNMELASTTDTANLNGQVADDGLPSGALHVSWSKFDGPGVVTFGNSSAPATTATFSAAGIYLLKLAADDGAVLRSDLVEVRVGVVCTNAPSGLVAWWQGNGTANDAIGANNGRLAGGTTFSSGKVSAAFSFDGTNDAVQIPAHPSLDVGLGAGFSIEFWMNSADVARSARLVGFHSGLGTGTNFGVNVLQGSANLYAQIYDLTGNSHELIAFTTLANNTWAHVAVTYERATGQAKIYINGVLKTTLTVGSYTARTSYNLFFGNVPSDASYYKGLLDEVSLYNRVLTLAEVQSVFNAGSGGKCPTSSGGSPNSTRPQFTASAEQSEPTVSFTENEFGLRTAMTDLSGNTAYDYDAQHHLAEVRKTWSSVAGLPPLTSSLFYTYDSAGRLISVRSSNANGMSVQYGYDSANRLVEVLDPHAGRTVYNYDGAGRLVGCTYPNGQNGTVTAPLASSGSDTQLGSVSTTDGVNTTTSVYDGDGNLVLTSVASSTRTVVTYYVIDPLNLTGAPIVAEQLTFDSADPLLSTPSVLRVNTYGYHLISHDDFLNGDWVLTFSE